MPRLDKPGEDDKELIMNCPWCDQPSALGLNGFCSVECRDEAGYEYEKYLDKFNDYMAGYPVTFEKMKRKPKQEEQ